jgi:tRNA 2-thiouridine synthesizing protein A
MVKALNEDLVRLDLRGLRCPLPVLRIRKALRSMEPGSTLIALCDDPLAAVDVPHFVRTTGDELIEIVDGPARAFRIRRAARARPGPGSAAASS